MQIPHDLPQFKDKRVLFVVSNTHEAQLYLAKRGHISPLERVEVLLTGFGRKESAFHTHNQSGDLVKTGAVYEKDHSEDQNKYYRRLNSRLRDLLKKDRFDEIYLFAPRATMTTLRSHLSEQVIDTVQRSLHGNYYQKHIIELVAKIGKIKMKKERKQELAKRQERTAGRIQLAKDLQQRSAGWRGRYPLKSN